MKAKCYLGSLITLIIIIGSSSCKKLVEVEAPITSVNQSLVYGSDAQAIAVLTGIYTNMSTANFDFSSGITSTSLICGLSADELVPINTNNQHRNEYYTNSLNSETSNIWASMYNTIYVANAAIEGITTSTTLTSAVKQQLLGEGKFIRALCYFYLINLYGDVPLALSTDYKKNSTLPRNSVESVYSQVILDLKDAKSLLSSNYLDATLLNVTSERVRPTKGAAMALLARVYLFNKDYAEAEMEASDLINQNSKYKLVGLDSVFLKNNSEAIWQILPTGSAGNFTANTKEGLLFIPITNVTDVYLNHSLINAFEIGDQRKLKWIGTFTGVQYPNKYKIGRVNSTSVEYSTILRLGEVYLVRAEARAYQGKLVGVHSAMEDLDKIRRRAGLDGTTSTTLGQMQRAILHERQVELFTEMGHRWLDLKRTETADAVLLEIKGATWQLTDQLYPLPATEILRNPSISGYQNPGY
jgi:hypothetical protein